MTMYHVLWTKPGPGLAPAPPPSPLPPTNMVPPSQSQAGPAQDPAAGEGASSGDPLHVSAPEAPINIYMKYVHDQVILV